MRWTEKPGAVFAVAFLVVALSLGWAARARYFQIPLLEEGDTAVNALQIHNAKHFSELYGNYSRFEFNHPGPAFFYIYALGEIVFHDVLHLSPSPGAAHLLASMLLQASFFSLGLAILQSHLRLPAWPALALLGTALYLGTMAEPFTSIWPPHVILMPFFCFLAAAISTALGRTNHAVALILAGSFLFHGHVAQAVFVGLLGGLSLALGFGRGWRQAATRHRRTLVAGAAIVGLFLLPLALDVLLYGRQGNVAGILGLYYANLHDRKSLFQALLYFLSFATRTTDQNVLLSEPGLQTVAFFREHAREIAGSLLALAALPAWAWHCVRRGRLEEARFYRFAALFVGAAAVLGVFWARSQIGAIEHFNGYFFYAIYTFGFLLAAGMLAGRVSARATPWAIGLCLAGSAVIFYRHHRDGDPAELKYATAIRGAVSAALREDAGGRPKFLVFEHAVWPTGASVALQLLREGSNYFMPPWWGFMFGARHEETELDGPVEAKARVWWISGPGPDGIPLSPELSLFTRPGPIRPEGDTIRFNSGENGFRYVVTGMSVGNTDAGATNRPRTLLLFAPQPARADVDLVLDAVDPTKTQVAEIFFNDVSLGRLEAVERSQLRVKVPRDLWNAQPEARLEIRFPNAKFHHLYKRPRYEWWTGWLIWSIRFQPSA